MRTKIFLFAFFSAFCVPAAAFGADRSASALISAREREAETAELRDVVRRRDAFFSESESLAENERSRRAEDVASRFESLSRRFPNSALVLYFYADFLRAGGENARAEELLLRAEKIDGAFPPLKFLLAETLAAQGRAEDAFPRFSDAVRLDPGDAAYHAAFGEFLTDSRERLLEKEIFRSRAELDAAVQQEFLAASAVEPENLNFLRRYAESFYDVENPDWRRALAAWERLRKKIPQEEKAASAPLISLHRARALAELGRIDEAYTLLRESAEFPALERSRRRVLEIIKQKQKKETR